MKSAHVFMAALGVAIFLAQPGMAADKDAPVQLITLDPGHFHAALVQKFMLPGVSPDVLVYAPAGDDLEQHLARVRSFNTRAEQATSWREIVESGSDWFERAMAPKETITIHVHNRKGVTTEPQRCVVVISGNNARKTEYITRSVNAGFNVLADKPMVIRPADYAQLEADFTTAKRKGVLLYDIMTERFEIATILQRALSRNSALFGTLERGTVDDPAITKISVHNFSKVVAGAQLKRPEWFFDPEQQGAGIVDVTTHLVDLVQWEAFPDVALKPADAIVLTARRWATPLTLEQYSRLTGAHQFPSFLSKYVKDGVMQAPSNGAFTYALRGVHAKISVTWDFEAPPGGGDTHFSAMRGTRATLTIKQGAEQKFQPTLYVTRNPSVPSADFERALKSAIEGVAKTWPGIGVAMEADHAVVTIPDRYHVGHEAHFGQVTENFLKYLEDGKLPDWEVPNMLTKYATIMQAYEMSAGK